MHKKVGIADRILRVTFGITFLFLGILKFFSPIWSSLFTFLGIEVLLVALLGYSPLYHLLDTSTHKPRITAKEEVAKWTTGPDSEK